MKCIQNNYDVIIVFLNIETNEKQCKAIMRFVRFRMVRN